SICLAVVWIAVDSINKLILGIRISFERTILVVERFLNSLVKDYGKHHFFTDGEEHGIHTCL
ncbi:MAG TPA: hypothetical protein VF233_02435, partial [Nitrososphaeraceae archaeon]